MSKPKRIRWEVRWDRKIGEWGIWCYPIGNLDRYHRLKRNAVKSAAKSCRECLAEFGELSELTIKRKDGTIQDKRTYGKDPRRTRG